MYFAEMDHPNLPCTHNWGNIEKTHEAACAALHSEIVKDCTPRWTSQKMEVEIKTLPPIGPHLHYGGMYQCVANQKITYKHVEPESISESFGEYGRAFKKYICSINGTLPKSSSDLRNYSQSGKYLEVLENEECPSICPVEPLKPITDPETLRFENGDTLREDLLAPSMKTKLACLKDAVSKAGGKLTPKSAWRPIGYQEHFYEIFTKFKALQREENKKIDACKPILKSITYEKNTKHGIQGNVAPPSTSLHEKGLAFDATWEKITTAKVDALAATCGLNRPLKVTDRVHFQ